MQGIGKILRDKQLKNVEKTFACWRRWKKATVKEAYRAKGRWKRKRRGWQDEIRWVIEDKVG